MSSFQCPHCSASLRIQDRMYVGKQVSCPDCEQQILIVADGPKGFLAQKAEAVLPETTAEPSRKFENSGRPAGKVGDSSETSESLLRAIRFARRLGKVLSNPVGISWTVAISALLLLIAAVWMSDDRNQNRKAPLSNDVPVANAEEPQDVIKPPAAAIDSEPKHDVNINHQDGVRPRLTTFGERLLRLEKQQGHFPPGTRFVEGRPPRERFSWLAELAGFQPGGRNQPEWDQPWRAPLNDGFVRRRIPEFQNPAIAITVGETGHPATHFVGVAGVGHDAATLPVKHRRAGVFGYNRETQIGDIKDGTANTMMIAGVQSHLGSWAAGGHATVRPFAKEPYVNGPDGFGTGQKNHMLVLMADGSLRTISVKTAPTIVRRMAAIADGLPLDSSVPGDPGDQPALQIANRNPDEQPLAPGEQPRDPANPEFPTRIQREPVEAKKPSVVVITEPEPEIDLSVLLSQKVRLYDLPRAVPFGTVLAELEEMLGAPIRFDSEQIEDGSELLEKPIRIQSLTDTTVGQILRAAAMRVGLVYELGRNEILLHPSPAKILDDSL